MKEKFSFLWNKIWLIHSISPWVVTLENLDPKTIDGWQIGTMKKHGILITIYADESYLYVLSPHPEEKSMKIPFKAITKLTHEDIPFLKKKDPLMLDILEMWWQYEDEVSFERKREYI